VDITAIVLTYVAGFGLIWEGLGMASGRGWIPWRIPLISPVMRYNGRLWLIWPWLWGVLPGHWWYWVGAPENAWIILLLLTTGLITVDGWRRLHGDLPPKQAPFVVFLLGIAAGALCWAMGY
jgi:hypothetical protein